MKIRDFRDNDFEHLTSLVNDFENYLVDVDAKQIRKPFDSLADCKKYVSQLIADRDEREGAFLVAEENGKIVGFVQGIIDRNDSDLLYTLTHKRGIHGWIGLLFVSLEFRSKGIAKALIDGIILYFKQRDCTEVNLHVSADNMLARAVYSKYGFAERDLEMAIDL